ncbi:MAG: helix-turn-helix transcriptional regulator [Gammaproteobacteria bacterium]|nr:helix-turn-helix transcriptional regulator [Gammaproteobacteria bacterium]MYK44202.1 helix-turn-helix transcriptional regulator [Gammaproteobacteria bacterium]
MRLISMKNQDERKFSYDTFNPNTMKQIRILCGYTQQEVADETELSVASISFYERGTVRPPEGKLLKIAEVYNCQISDFCVDISDGQMARIRKSLMSTLEDFSDSRDYREVRVASDLFKVLSGVEAWEEHMKQQQEQTQAAATLTEVLKDADSGSKPENVDYGSVDEGEVGKEDHSDLPPNINHDNTETGIQNA